MITIRDLETVRRTATITIDYEDALCLVNSMYQLSQSDKIEKRRQF